MKQQGYICAAVVSLVLGMAGTALSETPQEAANKATVIEFYNKELNDKDFDAASKFFGPNYINHNPTAADGIDGIKAYVESLKRDFPKARNQIVRAFADGDFVILHVHAQRTPDVRGKAMVDMFRLDHGKIVEHWAVVGGDLPDKPANNNGAF